MGPATIDQEDKEAVPLLLLPGTLCDERVFAPVLERLPPRPVVFGNMHGLDSTTEIVDRLLPALPSRFVTFGFSLGAIVALELAARIPQRIAGMILANGTARNVPAELHAARRAAASQCAARHHVETVLWPQYVAGHRHLDGQLKDIVLAMAEAAPTDALVRQTEVALSRADSRDRLHLLDVPCLVIGGEEDRISPPSLQQEMTSLLPEARLEIIPHAGHFALLEEPAACAGAIAGWLDALDDRTSWNIGEGEARHG